MVAVGECMLELAGDARDWRMGYAGDSFNTALYLQRLGVPTSYLTALGSDPFSQEMLNSWRAEGLDVSLVLTDSKRLPGLYAIRTDAAGERSFFYWRKQSAARRLFKLTGLEAALHAAAQARILYLSGITLSLFSAAERARLVQLASAVRNAGGAVAFDLNYRPTAWPSARSARMAMEQIAPHVSCALHTFEDTALLFGDSSPEHTVERWRAWGCQEIAVKLGAEGCVIADRAQSVHLPAPEAVSVVDTTGAGDAFNAGFLAARLACAELSGAARAAQILAAAVIGQRGAILPPEAMAAVRRAMHLQ